MAVKRKQLTLMVICALPLVVGCTQQTSGTADAGEESAKVPSAQWVIPSAGGQATTFATAIEPVVAARCARCHVEDSKGGLSLSSRESLLAGGKSGPVVTPGDASNSKLFKAVSGDPSVKKMPPKGEPLSPSDVAAIKAWIDSGAN